MRKSILTIACLSAIFLVGCKREVLEPHSEGVYFTVPDFAREYSSLTKTAIAENGTSFVWSPTDSVGIFPGNGNQVFFSMADGAGASTAVFDGGGWLLRDASEYWSYYPLVGDIYLEKDSIPVSYVGQKQKSNGGLDHIGAYDHMYTGKSRPLDGYLNFGYHHINCIINPVLSLPAGTYTRLELSSVNPIFVESMSYDLTSGDASLNSGSVKYVNKLSMTLDDIVVDDETPLDAYMMMYPVDASQQTITITVFTDQGASSSFDYVCESPFESGVIYTIAAAQDYVDSDIYLSLVDELYEQFVLFFNGEHMYAYTNYGTDEFMVAGDSSNGMWNDYDSRLDCVVSPAVNSNTTKSDAFWRPIFQGIGKANEILSNSLSLKKDSNYNNVVGTAAFVRAFSYLFLVMQYGDLPLVLDPVDSPAGDYPRVHQSEIYELIIKDLELAHSLLPDSPSLAVSPYNRITKFAAAHYLAQAHLWRASDINDSWNTAFKENDLSDVIRYADEVIAAHPLTPNYEDLFANFMTYDTDITETNTEIVLSSGSSDSAITNRRSHWGLALFTTWYQSFPFMQRDVAAAREYQRLKTTPSYAYYLYDLQNDSRFWKSFKTTYAINKCVTNANNAAKTLSFPDGTSAIAGEYFDSDFSSYLSTMYIVNREDYGVKYYRSQVNASKAPAYPIFTVKDYRTDKYIPCLNALLIYDDWGNVIGTSMQPDYETLAAPLNKYLDGAVNTNNRGDGFRDGILARSAEDYFFKAEALIRQGKIDEGLAALQPIRERAQYKAGESRDAYVDGGQAWESNPYRESVTSFKDVSAFYPMNSYYYSLGLDKKATLDKTPSTLPLVTKNSYPVEDQKFMTKLGYTSDYDKAMCFLLDEKSREMYGEFKRWMDLARTKTLQKRLVFNDQAYSRQLVDITGNFYNVAGYRYALSQNGGNFNPYKHYLRPIPVVYFDRLTKDGKPIPLSEMEELQNPGYSVPKYSTSGIEKPGTEIGEW